MKMNELEFGYNKDIKDMYLTNEEGNLMILFDCFEIKENKVWMYRENKKILLGFYKCDCKVRFKEKI